MFVNTQKSECDSSFECSLISKMLNFCFSHMCENEKFNSRLQKLTHLKLIPKQTFSAYWFKLVQTFTGLIYDTYLKVTKIITAIDKTMMLNKYPIQ
jgi:hypothetical protein